MKKQIKAFFVLLATLHIASGASVTHKVIPTETGRDVAISETLYDSGETIKCLLQLPNSEIPDKIHNVWTEHLESLQKHPEKPLDSNLAMDVLYEKGKETLNKLQSIDTQCRSRPFACQGNATSFEIETPSDLYDIANSLELLAREMFCLLGDSEKDHEVYGLFEQSFERIHSDFDTTGTAVSRINIEYQQLIKELLISDSNCYNIIVRGDECLPNEQ